MRRPNLSVLTRHSLTLLALVLGLTGCALLTPLEDVKGPRGCVGKDCPDAGSTGSQTSNSKCSGSNCTASTALPETCATTDDGRCDEPHGSNTCAAGSDTKDCQCAPKLPSASCDPIAQCNCDRDSTCEVSMLARDVVLTANCTRAGSARKHEPCEKTADCARGLFCDEALKLCSNYCSNDQGCEDGACLPIPKQRDPELGQCAVACARETNAPCTPGTSCAEFDRTRKGFAAISGNFCTVPLHEGCPRDGVCDEPQGTGLCAAGTDAADCCKPPSIDGECDPVSQCGCENQPGTQCQHVPDTTQTVCAPVGTKGPGDACSFWKQQCPPGYACDFGACRKYCQKDPECGGARNFCLPTRDVAGDELKGIGTCYVSCDFADPQACGELACARFTDTASYCLKPFSPCPPRFIGDGKCDDTREGGTRMCELRTDSDCK